MSKAITHELRYDGATPEQVHAMLADPEFREEVCAYQGYPEREVSIEPKGDGMTVVVDQHRPADEVPSFAQKFVGDQINILQEEDWSDPTHADLTVTIPGKPGHMSGTIVLKGDDAGTTETVNVEVKVKIPLVGGKIESFIADLLLHALKAENKVGRDWLASH